MKRLLILIGIIMVLAGCKKPRSYEYHIGIENQTNTQLHFTLFTVKGKSLDYYANSSPFNGTSPKVFTLEPDQSVILFSTDYEISNPCLLVNEIFDSIQVVIDSSTSIHFKPESVENYQKNIFSDNTNWSYLETEIDLKGNYSTIGIQVDIYHYFLINDDDSEAFVLQEK